MKANFTLYLLTGGMLLLSAPLAHASVAKIATELVEMIAKNRGREGLEEVAKFGGEHAVREVFEKAYAEGGETLARKLAAQTELYGPAILHGAKSSPAKFLDAFDQVPINFRSASVQAMQREPQLMANLVARYGDEALIAGAKHPGVGPKLLSALGDDGVGLVSKLSTDEAIQLSRLTPKLTQVAPAQRRELLGLIAKAPGKILGLLEQNPRVLTTGAVLAGFLASKDQLLGEDQIIIGEDGKPTVVSTPGFLNRFAKEHKAGVGYIFGAIGLGILGWFGVHIWRIYILSKAKIKSAEIAARKD